MDERFAAAIAAIDAANADDPNTILVRGATRPKELAHAELVTEWVQRLEPDAHEALLLAARAHHIRRWTIPRASYPTGRPGYLRWRKALHTVHEQEVGRILAAVGYDETTITRVQQLVAKRGLGHDADVQVLEDALCLVFVETQLHDLARRLDHDKMVDVAAKTLAKMSDPAIAQAATIPLAAPDRTLLEAALARRRVS
jgi:hypothetical protein